MLHALPRARSLVRQMSTPPPQMPSVTAALVRFSTCELSDALIKLGVSHGGLIPDVQRMTVYSGSAEERVCGPAYTVQMVLASDADAPKLSQHFVDTAENGSIIVIGAPSQAKNAVWGGLMTAGAQARGARGVVISGCCRDLAEQNALRFPLFARGHSTLGQSPFTRPSAVQIPLRIEPQPEGCGFPAIIVQPGDFVVGDADGVVCVPKDMTNEVMELAEKGRAVDAKCMADIKAGLGVQASFKKHRGK
ncbi:ribonuclease E inhibitor RraA/Dimethylmenaquinone methyltransferase [Phellopilus nigrolimitatus]|nr:ribonuclease E inhibitor RraA/Dimethylmenaquinone methyltransferase [Phellopilus nigrolimitatus]